MSVKTTIITIAMIIVIVFLVGAGFYISQLQKEKVFNEGIMAAKSNFDSKNYSKAIEVLNNLLKTHPYSRSANVARYSLALTYYETKNYNKAKEVFEEFLKKRPATDYIDDAYYYLGTIYLDSDNDMTKAKEMFDKILKECPQSNRVNWAKLGLAKIPYIQGDIRDAKAKLDAVYAEVKDDTELKNEVEKVLGDVNLKMLYSPYTNAEDIIYTVKKGDLLASIAKEHGLTYELLLKCNNLRPRALVVGQRIKVPKLNFSILIDKFTNTLTLLNNGKFFKKYTVRTGKLDYQTPNGEYKVLSKEKEPVWNNPKDGKKYKGGDPNNELGARWMAFVGASLGIHGTIHPETLGKYSSNGCVGMYMPEVEELFDLVLIGTTIKIVGQQNPALVEHTKEQISM